MINAETSSSEDDWTLTLILKSAEKEIKSGNYTKAQRLCHHGQSEAIKKDMRIWVNTFNDLLIEISNLSLIHI